MSVAFRYEGTVVEGTHLPEDLIPAFMDVLHDLDPAGAAFVEKAEHEFFDCADEHGYEYACGLFEMDAMYLTHEILFPMMQHTAPEGYYFGAHEGDGSDLGYWRDEEE